MSDTANRGRMLFILMTNRPDKLDVDIKRAGRLDRKIPFLYRRRRGGRADVARAVPQEPRRRPTVDFAAIRERFSAQAGRLLQRRHRGRRPARQRRCGARRRRRRAGAEHFTRAATDYFPSRDVEMLEYMELLAVFEASSRRLLPAKYAATTPEELDLRMRQLRAIVGTRR